MKKYALLLIFVAAGFPVLADLPDSIKNGSDFYIIYMDAESEADLGTKVKEKSMLRAYDIWPDGRTLTVETRTGVNAWGVDAVTWVALDVDTGATSERWNGGAIVAVLDEFDKAPDLSAIDGDYYFHFAIKSPDSQPDATWTLQLFYNDNDHKVAYYVGPQTDNEATTNVTRMGNYEHNGEWQHFEISVSELRSKGYVWNGPLSADNGRVYLLGFQDPRNVVGTELNLDAIFFYKKPAGSGITLPAVKANALSVYPNPSGNTLYIKGTDGSVAASILDLTGKTVLTRVLSEEGIDISGLSRGVYFLEINNQAVKFIKK